MEIGLHQAEKSLEQVAFRPDLRAAEGHIGLPRAPLLPQEQALRSPRPLQDVIDAFSLFSDFGE